VFGSDQTYNIGIEIVRSEAEAATTQLGQFLNILETYLKKVSVNPKSNSALEQCHNYMWEQINDLPINFPQIYVDQYYGPLKYPIPPYICFEQYMFAERGNARGYKKFTKEYNDVISTSTFGHLYDYREIIKCLMNEAELIKNSLSTDFGEKYEDESQQQIASYYFYWYKMAMHYQKLFAENLPSSPTGLPEAEVDKATQKQAIQFQALFSIKVDSLTTLIDSQLESLYSDLITNCDVFYKNFLTPSLRFKTKVISELSTNLRTSRMISEFPILSEEAVSGVLIGEGNFKSLMTDLLERRNNTTSKIDNLYQNILRRRKYVNYISQLENKGIKKTNVYTEKGDSLYELLLESIEHEDNSKNVKSSHSLLDDLGQDSHPQYLMKSGRNLEWRYIFRRTGIHRWHKDSNTQT